MSVDSAVRSPGLTIDDLPDEIINCILSYLNVEDAVKACTIILSKRWKYMLSNLVTLNFDASETVFINRNNAKKYASWVNHVLKLHSTPNINEFRVRFVLSEETVDCFGYIDHWVDFAASKHVKKLELDFTSVPSDRKEIRYDFRRGFRFGCFENGFSLLNSLCLKYVSIGGELFGMILNRCKYLERLVLEDSNLIVQLTKLEVTNPFCRLKHFALRGCKGINEIEVDIAAAVSLQLESEFITWEDNSAVFTVKYYIGYFRGLGQEVECTLEVNFAEDKKNIIGRVNDVGSAGLLVVPSSRLIDSNNCFKSLHLKSVDTINAGFLESLMIHFQFLEELVLEKVHNLVEMKIASSLCRLKNVYIDRCDNFKKLEIHLLDVVSLNVSGFCSNPAATSLNDNNTILFDNFPRAASINVKIDYCARGTKHNCSTDVKYDDSTVKGTIDDHSNSGFFLLKSLLLWDINVSGRVLELLLSRFSLLERLFVVRSGNNLVRLKITEESSKNLQDLEIHECRKLKQLELHAPNLSTLKLFHNDRLNNVIYGNVPSLNKVCFAESRRHRFYEHIRNIYPQSTQLCLYAPMIREGLANTIPTFYNVRQLELIIELEHHENLLPIKHFAEACPVLHEFKLEIKWDCVCDITHDDESSDEEERVNEGEVALEDVQKWLDDTQEVDRLNGCVLPRLRKFELVGAFQFESHIGNEYSLVLYMIKHATELEKFICNVADSSDVEFSDKIPELAELIKERQIDAARQLAKAIPSKINVEIK